MAGLSGIALVIGTVTVAVTVIKALKFIAIHALPSNIGRYAHRTAGDEPPWALVTGASDGIGRAFAHELAGHGFNVVLHGRNHAKLAKVQAQLQKSHPERSFRILIADAGTVSCVNCLATDQLQMDSGSPSSGINFEAIRAAVADIPLTVLINNAGGGPVDPVYRSLAESSEARLAGNISLNALFPLHLTRVLLPNLEKNAPALVMNVSSMADAGFPLLVPYSASKQFLMNFTRAVRLERALERSPGEVELLGVRVAKTTGGTHFQNPPSFFMPSSETMARACLSKAGRGYGVVDAYFGHALQQLFLNSLPAVLAEKFMVDAIRQEEADELKRS